MEETLERMAWHLLLYNLEKIVLNAVANAVRYRRIGLKSPDDPRRLAKIEVRRCSVVQ